MMLGCANNLQYTLFLEHEPFDTAEIESRIAALNTEFNEKRRSGRLKPIHVIFVKEGTGEAYKQDAIGRGQREGQYKLVHLQYEENNLFDFRPYVIGQGER